MNTKADRATTTKIATLGGVREYCEGGSVELWLNSDGRAVVKAYNECGNNYTAIDLRDLLDWVSGNVDPLTERENGTTEGPVRTSTLRN